MKFYRGKNGKNLESKKKKMEKFTKIEIFKRSFLLNLLFSKKSKNRQQNTSRNNLKPR